MPQDFDPYRRWLGILPEEQPPNHYRLLGLSLFEADPEVIEQAADRQISHVQRHKTGEWTAHCNALIGELAAARLCLLQAGSKAAYDQHLRSVMAPMMPTAPAPVAPGLVAPGLVAPPTAAPYRPQARPAPIPVQTVAPTVAPIEVVADFTEMDSEPVGPRRSKHARRKSNSNSNSLVVAGFVIAAGLCVCAIGWAVMNASTTKPPVAAAHGGTAPTGSASAGNDASTHAAKQRPTPAPSKDPGSASPAPVSQPEISPAGDVVDLLALIQPERDAQDGKWRKQRGKLFMLGAGTRGHARLQIPYHPPAEYQLDLTVARQGMGEVGLGLVIGRTQVVAILDGWEGTVSAFNLIDGKAGPDAPGAHQGQVLAPGASANVSVVVKRKQITVACNGQTILQWRGDPARLSLDSEFAVSDKRALFLTGYQKGFALNRLQLTPISGSGQAVQPPAASLVSGAEQPGQGTDSSTVEPGGDPAGEGPTSAPIAPKRFAAAGGSDKPRPAAPPVAGNLADVPDEAARQETLKLVRDVYADAYKLAKKPPEKIALAERLLGEAAKSDNPLEQFVLFGEARSLAVAGESPALVVQAIQQLGFRFKVPVEEAIAESLEQMNHESLPAPIRKELAESLLPIADRQIDAENYSVARRLLMLALAAAKKTNDKQLVKDITTRGSEVTELRRAADGLKTAQKTLDENPDDPDANLAKGKFLCLVKDDWAAGLPHLAKASDSGLQEVARLELAASGTAEEQAKIGDAWWTLAEGAKGREKVQYQARAGHWYRTALPTLKGLSQTKVSKRLEELAATTTKVKPAGNTTAASAKPAEKLGGAAALKNLPQRIKLAAKKESLVRTRLGGSGTGLSFVDVSDAGLLVGFNYTSVERFNWSYIASIQPIYQTQRGVVTGHVYGIPLGEVRVVLAKKGYAVAGIHGALQSYLYGLEVIFNAVDASGNLNPQDAYKSDWQGSGQDYYQVTVGDNGLPVIGIYGTGGDYLTGLGLVQLPKQ